MISNDVHSRTCLLGRGGQDKKLTEEKAILAMKGFEDSICVLVYNMHTHQENVRLLTHKHGIVHPPVKEYPFFISKNKPNRNLELSKREYKTNLLPSKRGPSPYSHKFVFLPHRVSMLDDKKNLKRHGEENNARSLLDYTFLSHCRGRIRKEKLVFLKRSMNSTWEKHYGLHLISKKVDNGFLGSKMCYNTIKGKEQAINTSQTNQKKIRGKSKSIWRGFTNTLMRHGSKLQYQSVLRKALLKALPDSF